MIMKTLIVGQSGGPTSVINGSLAGVYEAAKKEGFDKVYGMLNGIEGLLEDKIVDLDKYLDNEDNLELLKRTPSSFLGTCRFKLGKVEEHEDLYEKIFDILDKHNIDS
ncbi:MAG: 6-phosphofructokinase, partial [Bacilli bacterium]|nr:6-phosphofructokinase [Bacilli bacterium]